MSEYEGDLGAWRNQSLDDPVYLPVGIPESFQALIDTSPPQVAEALSRQVLPHPQESQVQDDESFDPLGEARYLVTPRLVHQYPSRVLLLSTGQCLGYCRYCFRRGFIARSTGFISPQEQKEVCSWLSTHPEVREILVSGGDPLGAGINELERLLNGIHQVRPDILIRFCTRGVIYAPERFTRELLLLLRSVRPLWVIPHINHPGELGPQQRQCIEKILDSGISLQSQTVLLNGINDSAGILVDLFQTLASLGVKPGYLFQCDLAPGISAFRVPLSRSLPLWRELRRQLSGLSLPEFAVDLPGGGGKFPLSAVAIQSQIASASPPAPLRVEGLDGKVYTYPYD